MNYIWDVLLKSDEECISREKIKFILPEICSPYMEISFIDINNTMLPEDKTVEVNPYYRFYDIFKDLFDINMEESKELREVLFDIVVHYLGELDLNQGLCKEEFYKKFFMRDIKNGIFGQELYSDINILSKEELDYILSGLITLYITGVSLHLFNKILKKVFKNNRVYLNQDNPKDMYIYLGQPKTNDLNKKIEIITKLFLPINMNAFIYWDYHFGILDAEKTMVLDEIVMM
ncbi:hypothetical protein [Clostridium frigidicarnis]|uniref:Iron-dependent peroxidase n=1 Tax=Clostridium frigidicarnis TaxID=84698 RepID=A0A1I0VW54_9CLOT|nr:hypothetical protein [Clostridium frigidicarnis]SFA80150.1 hypothetical protein SAMN04488528_100349 [Clostridium frigidicarnis]